MHAGIAIWALLATAAEATSRTPNADAVAETEVERPPAERLAPGTLTPEIRDWLRRAVEPTGTDTERMRRVLTALAARHFDYDNRYTGTAVDVFEQRRFNCLSLAHLVVALGRELGVDTYYVRIEEFRSFHQRGDLVLVSTHVAAGWGPPRDTQIVEFEETTDRERRAAYRITDEQALGLHYANRGAELLRAGWPALAHAWLEQATAIDEGGAEAWVNLGVAERRLGDYPAAEAAYRRALAIDGDTLSAWRNLASLYQLQRDPAAARKILDLLDRPGNRNPFTFLALGDLCAGTGALDDAERFYRRANQLAHHHPQILAARGELALARGDREAAATWLARARRADPAEPRVAALQQTLEQKLEQAVTAQ
ncbi:MAG: tetratricopeptide repeat protein [Myxococcota bacterium]